MNMSAFCDWTPKAIEERLKEAMRTHMSLPRDQGPKEFGNAMPEIVREKWKDAAPDATRYRRRLSPGALSRMEECWSWCNTMLSQADRIFIDEWMRIKVSKGRKLDEMAEKNPSKAKSLNRTKTRICSVIANELNRNMLVRLNNGDCDVSENAASIASSTSGSPVTYTTFQREPDAKPQVDPTLAAVRVLKPRDIRARHSEKNRSLGAR